MLGACTDLSSLAAVMNPNSSQYSKLNLQNLVSGHQPTIEFRQHLATASYNKVAAWICFCIAFVVNSARLAPPKPLKEGRTVDEKFDVLFLYIIKDRALHNFYQKHCEQVSNEKEQEHCCRDCAGGGTCTAKHQRL